MNPLAVDLQIPKLQSIE